MIHLTKAFFKLSFGWRRGSGSVSVFSALTQPICHVLRKHKSSPLLMLLQHMTTWEKQGEGQGFNCGRDGGGQQTALHGTGGSGLTASSLNRKWIRNRIQTKERSRFFFLSSNRRLFPVNFQTLFLVVAFLWCHCVSTPFPPRCPIKPIHSLPTFSFAFPSHHVPRSYNTFCHMKRSHDHQRSPCWSATNFLKTLETANAA